MSNKHYQQDPDKIRPCRETFFFAISASVTVVELLRIGLFNTDVTHSIQPGSLVTRDLTYTAEWPGTVTARAVIGRSLDKTVRSTVQNNGPLREITVSRNWSELLFK
jgi:hypothetical protein